MKVWVWVGALVGLESCTNMEKYRTESIREKRAEEPLHERIILHVLKIFGPFCFTTLCVIAYF